ncbi:MAG TPA: VWA domain-containing protein [Blastocatellia bacterium]|nr:VWA domain-containing protein [Blastocatellia bacterium]
MKKRRWLNGCPLIVFALFFGLAVVDAQQPKPGPKQGDKNKPANGGSQDPTNPGQIKQIIFNVRLPITVSDKNNRFVVDLKESDFEIIEDKTPQAIISFNPLSNLPLDVAMLMDTSNSVKPKLKFERDAAYSFLETVLKFRQDRALFATFDSQVELHQDLTNRLDLLTKAIDKIKAQGGTKMYDAVYSVCEEKMMSGAVIGRRRVMVVITDGEDTESERTLQDAIDIAQRSETTVYVISTKAGGFFGVQAGTVDRREDRDLKRLAEETGGRAFFTAEVIELEKSLTQITRELRNQYMIAYQPTNENYDGKERRIEVKLPNHKGLKVRTKTGYKATPRGVTSANQ